MKREEKSIRVKAMEERMKLLREQVNYQKKIFILQLISITH